MLVGGPAGVSSLPTVETRVCLLCFGTVKRISEYTEDFSYYPSQASFQAVAQLQRIPSLAEYRTCTAPSISLYALICQTTFSHV